MFREVTKWHLLLPKEELNQWPQNGLKKVAFKGKTLCIAYVNERYFALKNKCPHAGADLSLGWINQQEELVCPLHRFTFQCQSGENTSGQGFYVENYPLKIQDGDLFIGLKQWRLSV